VEERLEEILSCIRGAGKVQVMVIYDTSVEIVPAMSVDSQTSTSETANGSGQTVNQNQSEKKTPITVSGEDGALVLTQKQPEIRGVIVVAEGAADISVRLNLQNAVQTVLNIDAENISVFEMTLTDRSK
jgi:stage III sporulation protein AG